MHESDPAAEDLDSPLDELTLGELFEILAEPDHPRYAEAQAHERELSKSFAGVTEVWDTLNDSILRVARAVSTPSPQVSNQVISDHSSPLADWRPGEMHEALDVRSLVHGGTAGLLAAAGAQTQLLRTMAEQLAVTAEAAEVSAQAALEAQQAAKIAERRELEMAEHARSSKKAAWVAVWVSIVGVGVAGAAIWVAIAMGA